MNTHAEIDRILSKKPGVVVIARFPMNHPVNNYSRTRVLDYVRHNCHFVTKVMLRGRFITDPMIIFGDCGKDERVGAVPALPDRQG